MVIFCLLPYRQLDDSSEGMLAEADWDQVQIQVKSGFLLLLSLLLLFLFFFFFCSIFCHCLDIVLVVITCSANNLCTSYHEIKLFLCNDHRRPGGGLGRGGRKCCF